MNILLACASGMSTSLVVKKMEEAASQQGIDCKIWAVSQDVVEEEMKKADVLLIGPQMRFLKAKLEPKANEVGIKVDVIKPMDYGRCDGKAILATAISMISK
ncbi:PTS sugar transporter subunit IIB [Clostridium manihotivorum]|jgi:PTS system cellobiose-specific IIB component|uniref:PTS sugar transporter subunit IIB n=1 Tax=Clostridium manihotivorum TaxID=2320868 RepID=A0A410DZJ6_9CLOT|nr:PTS sugar transporter subunit IIB [Clostridium manihotivorum]QAA34519.1 PTS sugar transporter subunit IIB [Clostridium manihotivorum]